MTRGRSDERVRERTHRDGEDAQPAPRQPVVVRQDSPANVLGQRDGAALPPDRVAQGQRLLGGALHVGDGAVARGASMTAAG